jgi:hypothetical protein
MSIKYDEQKTFNQGFIYIEIYRDQNRFKKNVGTKTYISEKNHVMSVR